jgi:ribonuclease HI
MGDVLRAMRKTIESWRTVGRLPVNRFVSEPPAIDSRGAHVRDDIMEHPARPFQCYTDGASRGNPGPSAFAFIIRKGDEIILEESDYLGMGTNNTAEYQAVLHGLRAAEAYREEDIQLISDSELVIRQIRGEYAVRKPHLASFCREVRDIAGRFRNLSFMTVPREHPCIIRADALCNLVLDKHDRKKSGCG